MANEDYFDDDYFHEDGDDRYFQEDYFHDEDASGSVGGAKSSGVCKGFLLGIYNPSA